MRKFFLNRQAFFWANTVAHTHTHPLIHTKEKKSISLAYLIRLCGRLYKTLLVTYERSVCYVNAST